MTPPAVVVVHRVRPATPMVVRRRVANVSVTQRVAVIARLEPCVMVSSAPIAVASVRWIHSVAWAEHVTSIVMPVAMSRTVGASLDVGGLGGIRAVLLSRVRAVIHPRVFARLMQTAAAAVLMRCISR